MRKKGSPLLLLYILCFCGFLSVNTIASDDNFVEIEDAAGRKVSVPSKIERIVSLSPSNTEILFALGAGDMVFGVTDYCNYPEVACKKPKIGGFSDISLERVVAANPDLVLASHLNISKVVPALEHLGLTVVVTNPDDIPSVLDTIELFGKLLKAEKKAHILTGQMREQISYIEEKIKGKKKIRVFLELSSDFWTAGKGSFIDDLISRAGGENIAATIDAPWLQLSGEYIIDADPGVIFLADHPFGISKEKIVARPGWEIMTAVKNKRIIEITAEQTDLISRPGPRVVQALTFIAKILHPDCFRERSSQDS